MREVIFKNSKTLYGTDWVELRRMEVPDKKIYGYDFLHEKRCSGIIVSFLPFRKSSDDSLEFLLRCEATPCWELDTPVLSSFTGGVDKGSNPGDTFLHELEEEAGYVIDSQDDPRIYVLGQSYSTKSSDTQYFLYAVDITDFPEEKMKDLYIESELEASSTNVWVDANKLSDIQDPFVAQIFVRFLASR